MEDTEYFETNDVAHNRLISAVSKLDKTQHIKDPTRNEPTNLNSEFNLIKSSKRLDIDNVVKVLENSAGHVKISKSFKKTQDTGRILSKPLEKPQVERLKRSTGYDETKDRVGRWDAVVARSRTVDCVHFPLKRASNKMLPTKEFLSKLELKSPLEQELEQIDPPQPAEEEVEEERIYPLTYQEMVTQRQHLAKFRAQQSFKAAKAKRQSKIKSKKYHRILKKEKLKQQLKEFEDLQKTNPEEALKKLEALEKERALERHTLRHKNTGKWAKNKMVRAKYDKEVRQQLAEQLSVGRSLTKKKQLEESSDDEAVDEGVPNITLSQDPKNHWMMKRSDKSIVSSEFDFGYKKYVQGRSASTNKDSDSGSEGETENDALSGNNNSDEVLSNKNIKGITKSTPNENIMNEFTNLESGIANKVAQKLQNLRDSIEKFEHRKKKTHQHNKDDEIDNVKYLQFKTQKPRAIIDEHLIETTRNTTDSLTEDNLLKPYISPVNQETNNLTIDVSRFVQAKPQYLKTPIVGVDDLDQLDDEEQGVPKVTIEEALEDDDLVDSFRQEKEDDINKNNPKDIDLSLPGWGTWGGKGVKAPKKRRNRFIVRGAIKMPRRDENKGDIIIREYKDPKLSIHKITEVPFPFTSVKDFEASIRAPLGNTFIPEKAHRKVIRPSLVTKSGTIIEPMDEDELLNTKNRSFKNKSVIHLLAKNKRQF